MVTTPFRITPSLGPELWQRTTQGHWDMIGDPLGTGAPSYQLGSTVIGNDGHKYTYVRTTIARASGATFAIDEATWNTTTGTTHNTAGRAVAAGECFHARQVAL